jgi:hypothetical protein
MNAEPPSSEEILKKIEEVSDPALSANQRKTRAKDLGWTHTGFLACLVDMYGFDLVKDVVPDLMHLTMVLVKDLVRITTNALQGWQNQPKDNPCGINTWREGVVRVRVRVILGLWFNREGDQLDPQGTGCWNGPG